MTDITGIEALTEGRAFNDAFDAACSLPPFEAGKIAGTLDAIAGPEVGDMYKTMFETVQMACNQATITAEDGTTSYDPAAITPETMLELGRVATNLNWAITEPSLASPTEATPSSQSGTTSTLAP